MTDTSFTNQPNSTNNPTEYKWSTRVRWLKDKKSNVYVRNLTFSVDQQASLKPGAEYPSALEYFLGALGADISAGFATQAARRGIVLDGLEISVTGCLNNTLVFLGVIGETGHPGLETIECRVYVNALDVEEETLQEIWQTVQTLSPIINTLKRCVTLNLEFKVVL